MAGNMLGYSVYWIHQQEIPAESVQRINSMSRFAESDLYKFNQLIHQLDDWAGGDYESEDAAILRTIRDKWFDEDGQPIEREEYAEEADSNYRSEYRNGGQF